MKSSLLLTSALALLAGTAAFGQSPNSTPDRTQPSSSSTSSSSPSSVAPASQSTTPTPNPSYNSAQTSPSTTNSATASQATSSGTGATSQPSQSTSAPNNSQAQSTPSTGASTPSSTPSANQAQSTSPSTPQSQNAPATNQNAAQQPAPANTNTNTNSLASQPSSSTNVNARVEINEQQRSRLSQSFARLDVHPVTNVNFSLTVGTPVPRDVRLEPLPADIVEVVPQYRGYSFFAVRDEIVIVEPATMKIVQVLPRSGGSTAVAHSKTKVSFSDRDRDVIRKHVHSRSQGRTTGNTSSTAVRIGERLPESVEIESFPEEVYRDAPTLREYRYIERGPRTYIIEPHERTVIDEID